MKKLLMNLILAQIPMSILAMNIACPKKDQIKLSEDYRGCFMAVPGQKCLMAKENGITWAGSAVFLDTKIEAEAHRLNAYSGSEEYSRKLLFSYIECIYKTNKPGWHAEYSLGLYGYVYRLNGLIDQEWGAPTVVEPRGPYIRWRRNCNNGVICKIILK